ncbi:branched-chain amino acid ABC transporter permease [Cellulomonas fimi]|uniref:Branched-chain amino acid ABC transporter permease n=1 Tax=Cellulomonas fimi TaxID=1708 RepID=A0A7Y0M006_CELFI|nr:branched-chain amino acid ABC transporter permease [Cellulomonas fimi]NMR21356.1 branched-chain amino acid ABC transporter permease [Cellulomonas fimi]
MGNALIIGLSLGCVYGFVAVGFSLIYRTTGVMNFAQGASVMLGGMGAGYAGQAWGLPLWAAALIGIGFALVGGLLLVLGVVLPLWKRGASDFITMLGTLLFLVAAENVILNTMGSDPRPVPRIDPQFTLQVGGLRIDSQSLWIILVAIVVSVGLGVFIARTSTGVAMRAVATDQKVARLMGVNPAKMAVITFTLAALIGGIGGVLVAPLQFAAWNAAHVYNIKGFIAAVVGGVLDVRTAFLGGIVIGVLEAFIVTYASSTYLDVLLLGVLLVLLLLRPSGIFGRAVAVKY